MLRGFSVNRTTIKIAGIAGILLILLVASALLGRTGTGAFGNAGTEGSGAWVYADGAWYYEAGGQRLTNQWVEDHIYFVDETGEMVKNEWIYHPLAEADYRHAEAIPADLFSGIDMGGLFYVGQDGKMLRNKRIYFSPFKFDNSGICSLTAEDIASAEDIVRFEGAEYGIEGLRRYAEFNGYREYY